MATTPEIMKTPKGYWLTRRTEGHSDWSFGFWRELFQNAVDAGAKTIAITVEDAQGKGSFGRNPTVENVVRVSFQDDGVGMDESILRDVFLRPGESTKKGGDFQGGFGTARIMLCYSQVRYSVRTQDWVVEGDGSEYTCLTAAGAAQSHRDEIARADADGATGRAARIRETLAELEVAPGRLRGCRLEIDVDPNEFPEHRWRNVDRRKLLEQLDGYLSMSQVPCKVLVNGEEAVARTLKGPARRKLVARLEDGSETEFATVHTSQGERAKYKGKMVVRTRGAAMFVDDVAAKDQVIVEIDPQQARAVLTDSRDRLKEPYQSALSAFLRELAVDTKSALEDKDKRRHVKFGGGHGLLVARPAAADLGAEGTVTARAAPKAPKARYTTREEYEVRGFGGAPRPAVDRFVDALARGEETFLGRLAEETGQQGDAERFLAAVRDGRGADSLRELGPELAGALAATLSVRAAEAAAVDRAAAAGRYADMHDIHIQVDDIEGNEKLETAVRRYSPSYWRRKGENLEGRGMNAHLLLAAWTACCQEAVDTLLSLRPCLAKDGEVHFATGFYFGKSDRTWNSRLQKYEETRTGAQHQERDGAHLLLINPVTDDGQPAHDMTVVRRDGIAGAAGFQDLEAGAIHEVAHMLEAYHDEDFANLMTAVAAVFNRARAHERMREAMDAVREVYGRGRSRVQEMENPEAPTEDAKARARRRQPRPAEVLLAHAAPITAMVAGAACAPENAHLDADALKEAAGGAVAQVAEGVAEVDCDRLQSLERQMAGLAAHDWKVDLDAIDLPPAALLDEFGDAARLEEPAQPAPFRLEALDLPAADDLPELADEPAPFHAAELGQAVEAPLDARHREPVRAPVPPATATASASQLAALRAFSDQLSALGPAPQPAPPPPAPPVVEDDAARGISLVGEEFDMEDFDMAGGPPGP